MKNHCFLPFTKHPRLLAKTDKKPSGLSTLTRAVSSQRQIGLRESRKAEMKYETNFALQNRCSFTVGSLRIFQRQVTDFWTLHQGRSYLPSATVLPLFQRLMGDFPGGWSATDSDRHAKIARARIANMQKSVVGLLHDRTSTGPLKESKTTQDFLEYC